MEKTCLICEKKFKARKKTQKFCSRRCFHDAHYRFSGEKSANWKGGRVLHRGYVKIYTPEHPNAILKYVHEQRLVMENHLGRFLEPEELVHHINEDRADNRLENLQVVSREEHRRIHNRKK